MRNRRFRHGMYGTPTYESFRRMRQRTTNPNAPDYQRYGAQGITCCDRWSSFELFFEDMGVRPPGTTLDRINRFGIYEPSNCRWATPREQASHTRMPRLCLVPKPRKRGNVYIVRILLKTYRFKTLEEAELLIANYQMEREMHWRLFR